MQKSEIIKKLMNEENSLTKTMNQLLMMLEDINNDHLKKIIEFELKGYDKEDELPKYRKVISYNFLYSGLNGGYKVVNAILPPSWLCEETLDKIKEVKITQPISEIEELVKEKKDLQLQLGTLLCDEIQQRTKQDSYDDGVKCTSIRQIIPRSWLNSIFKKVFYIVYETLVKLEKIYGNLDSLDLNSKTDSNKDRIENAEKANNQINLIVENVTMKKLIIKNSNIGNGKNETKKDWEFNPTISFASKSNE